MKNLIKKILKEGEGWSWMSDIEDVPAGDIIEVVKIIPPKDTPKNMFNITVSWEGHDTNQQSTYRFNSETDLEEFRKMVEFYKHMENKGDIFGDDIVDAAEEIGWDEDSLWDIWWNDDYYDMWATMGWFNITYYDGEGVKYQIKVK